MANDQGRSSSFPEAKQFDGQVACERSAVQPRIHDRHRGVFGTQVDFVSEGNVSRSSAQLDCLDPSPCLFAQFQADAASRQAIARAVEIERSHLGTRRPWQLRYGGRHSRGSGAANAESEVDFTFLGSRAFGLGLHGIDPHGRVDGSLALANGQGARHSIPVSMSAGRRRHTAAKPLGVCAAEGACCKLR